MEFHDLSSLLPFREEQVDAIEMRMRQNGWKPGSVVTLFEGKILDGRHRYLAAERVGIEPVYVDYQGNADPKEVADFVATENFESRHMSLDEKSFFLIKMVESGYWDPLPKGKHPSPDKRPPHQKTVEELARTLGVSRKSVFSWLENGPRYKANARTRTEVRTSAVPEVVGAMERGDITTKDAGILAALPEEKQVPALRGLESLPSIRTTTSGNDEWYTPVEYINMAREVMGGIDLDPASCEFAQKEVKADTFYTREDDGLIQDWKGRVWLNPPYSTGLLDKFAEKVRDEYRFGGVDQAIVLTHSFTDTKWFHLLATEAAAICLTKGRVRFYGEDGVKNSPPSGHVFFYLGPDIEAFAEQFSEVGLICVPHGGS